MKLASSWKNYVKYVMKPNLMDAAMFHGNLISFEMAKTEIAMKEPVYAGQAILDISNALMYEIHCKYMKTK